MLRLEAKAAKKVDHIKYFHNHILTKLKGVVDDNKKLGAQLNTKVEALEAENKAEVERLKKQSESEKAQVAADLKKKSDHLKYFHEHIMKLLNLKAEQFSGQLASRLGDLEEQKNSTLLEVERKGKASIEKLELNKQKKADHLKYFHEHIL